MPILDSCGLSANSPFCDWLNITVPYDLHRDVEDGLFPLLLDIGSRPGHEGIWHVPYLEPYKSPDGPKLVALSNIKAGTVFMARRGPVHMISASGTAVSSLRKSNMFLPWLAEFASVPHRVTRLDATVDVPLESPPILERAYQRGKKGLMNVGRKAVRPADVRYEMGIDLRGADTGTVYLGSRKNEIRACIYDKRHERERELCGSGEYVGIGMPDGPMTRFELSLKSDVGVTLADVANPGPVFWNYMNNIIEPPSDAPVWSKGDTGYDLPPRIELDPWTLLKRQLEDSPELPYLIRLADKMGPYGRDLLFAELAKVYPPLQKPAKAA